MSSQLCQCSVLGCFAFYENLRSTACQLAFGISEREPS
jgi:hypothetical protein